MRPLRSLVRLACCLAGGIAAEAWAEPVDFELPPEPADEALLAFSRQAKLDVLFSYDDLHWVRTSGVQGRFEPDRAIELLLQGTGFSAHRNDRGKLVVTRAPAPPRSPAAPPAAQPNETVRLDPMVVEGEPTRRDDPSARSLVGALAAAGNLDLPRSEDDALPFTIYHRDQITRSGFVDLNEYLQRELLDADPVTPVPSGDVRGFMFSGSTNLNLRGYGDEETVILVNGRRLPDVLIMGSNPGSSLAPDVSMIPVNLVERVEVLPVSASALYSGSPVGGVINIVLRSEVVPGRTEATEITTTYTNALRGFDAPEGSASLLHSENLLGGALQLRIAASFSQAAPPTESQLGFRLPLNPPAPDLSQAVYGATPNVRTADGSPLFGPGTASVASVAPGADGSGGLAAFAGREGVVNQGLFHLPGGWSTSPDSLDYAYGERQRRAVYYGSFDWTVTPRLQVGIDASYARTVTNPGYDLFNADLLLGASSPFNPFGKDVMVSVNESAPQLGFGYEEGEAQFYSVVAGLVFKLPADWRLTLDAQFDHSLAEYRGLLGADPTRWQQLVDEGLYNPLRDTRVYGPPQAFYDQVLIYENGRGQFATVGNYNTLDVSARATAPALRLPTGAATVNLGGDFHQDHFDDVTEDPVYGDGSPDGDPIPWIGRTLKEYSFFGELQAPLLPRRRLPAWIRSANADFALRYDVAATADERNLAPTVGLKLGLPAGFALRGSATTSTRYPDPLLSQQGAGSALPAGSPNTEVIYDPLRNQSYSVPYNDLLNPVLNAEGTVTESAGIVFERGRTHKIRVSLDFVDTGKTNEVDYLDAQTVVDLEPLLPERIIRAPLAPGDNSPAGVITSVLTGAANIYRRHSENWNASADYDWTECAGGTLGLYARLVAFTSYDRQILATSPVVDELHHPDGSVPDLLKYRVNFGAGWSKPSGGFGVDGHYYSSCILPVVEWPSQGSDRIAPYWQFDAYLQKDMTRWLPWLAPRYGLRGQVRVNDIFDRSFPAYADEASGAGVQPYGDWRGRTYSLSLTLTF